MEHITEFNGKTIAGVIAFKPSSAHYEFNAIQLYFTDGTYVDIQSVGEYGQGSSIDWSSGKAPGRIP